MKTIKTYMCWNTFCSKHKESKRLKEAELIKRKEDRGHIDFVCPECEKVIICIRREEQSRKNKA